MFFPVTFNHAHAYNASTYGILPQAREAGMTPGMFTTMLMKSHGRHFAFPSASHVDLRLSASPSSSPPPSNLWMSWRYARMTNVTLTLSASATLAPLLSGTLSTRFDCTTPSTGTCGAGLYRIGGILYQVDVDMGQRRGTLPLHIVAALRASHDACVTFEPVGQTMPADPLTLCGNELAFFDATSTSPSTMKRDDGGSSTYPVLIGADFWRHNYSITEMDGAAMTMIAQDAPGPVSQDELLAWQWTGIGFVLLLIVLHAVLVADSDTTLTYGIYLYHNHMSKRWRYVNRQWKKSKRMELWPAPRVFSIIAIIASVLSVPCMVIGWVGGTDAGIIGDFEPVTDGFDFNFLAGTLTAFIIAQLILHWTAFFVWELGSKHPDRRCGPWFTSHTMTIRVAWVRHLTLRTIIEAAITMASFPLAYAGGLSGDLIYVLFVALFSLQLVAHQTYYTIAMLGIGIGSKKSHWVTIAVGVFELALLALLVGALTNSYIAPVFNTYNVLYGPALTYIGAVLLLVTVVIATMATLIFEGFHMHQLIRADALARKKRA